MKLDKFLVAVTITVGVLAGLFNLAYVVYANSDATFNLTGLVVAGFLGWATFYAAGGGKDGLVKGIPANLSGVLWAVVIVFIWDKVFGFNVLGAFIAVGIGAGAMCFQAHLKWFGFIPGAFIGCSTFFALGAAINGDVLFPTIIGLLVGLGLGWVSQKSAILIQTNILEK
jgi:hypothetical protein